MTIVASKYELQENELYETEPWATRVFIKHFPVRNLLWHEPAAGNHKIANVLREEGADVFTSDIATYETEHDLILNYLECDYSTPRNYFDGVISNPPFGPGNRLAARFCELALERCDGFVGMLLTAGFDSGSSRTHLFRENPRFRAKISLLDRIQWFTSPDGKDTKGTGDHAWYVWGPEIAGEIIQPRMIWERNPECEAKENLKRQQAAIRADKRMRVAK